MTAIEWGECDDPLRLLGAVRGRADPAALRHYAVACCELIGGLLNEAGRSAIEVAGRFADGRASESERTAAERAVFEIDGYIRDLEVCFGDMPPDSHPGPAWHASEAAGGAVASDPWAGARQAARSVMEAVPETDCPAVRARLCQLLRERIASSPSPIINPSSA